VADDVLVPIFGRLPIRAITPELEGFVWSCRVLLGADPKYWSMCRASEVAEQDHTQRQQLTRRFV
jgi:hypothetical protein